MTDFFDRLALGIGTFWSAVCNPLISVLCVFCLAVEIFFQYRIFRKALPIMGQAAAGRVLDSGTRGAVKRMLDRCDRWRSLLLTLIPLFPQAGILGTVAALLLELAASGGVSTGSVNIRFAMTSTLYGLVAAIVLKVADVILAHGIDRIERELGAGTGEEA